MSEPVVANVVTEQDVVDYLREQPDFFLSHEQLLSELSLPHEAHGAVSLIERQVAVLRERNIQMRRRMNDLVQTARENDDLFAKTRSLIMALLESRDRHDLNEVLATSVLVDFDADFVCCHLQGDTHHYDHLIEHRDEMPHQPLVGSSAVCMTLRAEELARLFPAEHHDTQGSVVLVPLTTRTTEGALAIGSRNPERFTSDMDTLFVTYITDVLSRIIDRL